MKLLAIFLAVLLSPAVAWAQENVEVDPIRCWWRSSSGAVRTGEPFSVDLTCAVIENEAVQVVPDETRLGPAVIQMAPFEIVGGSHPADMKTPDRRFFQYEYNLRIINPDLIGKDVPIPVQMLHYRINSKVTGSAELQGRDHTYELPALSVRLVSMVPADTPDIRDSTGESFGEAEKYTLRAGILDIVGTTLVALGSVMTLLTLVRLARRGRRTRSTEEQVMSEASVLRTAQHELTSVQRDTEAQGWSEALVSRALAAARVAAGVAVGRQATQRRVGHGAETGDGRVVTRGWRRRKPIAVSSSATAEALASRLAALPPDGGNTRRELLEAFQSAISTLTASQYSRNGSFDRSALDAALGQAIEASRRLRMDRMWPKPQMRRWFGRVPQEHRQA